MREAIIEKISNISAKQFNIVLSKTDKEYLNSLGVPRELTHIKTLGKQVACLVMNITEKKCAICDNPIPYTDYKNYLSKKYCCFTCKKKDIKNINLNANKALRGNREAVEKRKRTYISRYGVSNIMQSERVIQQRELNSIEKHGVSHPSKLKYTVDKRRETNLIKYGTTNYLVKYAEEVGSSPRLAIKYDELLKLKNLTPLFSFEEYKGIIKDTKVVSYKFKCNECNSVFVKNICSWNDIESCSVCDKSINTYEQYIENLLTRHNIRYEKRNRSILDGLEIDFFIPDLNIGIEVDGLYYHSSKFVDKSYHLSKTLKCEEKGIQLLHIFGDELYNKKALETRLKSILGVNKIIVGARKCIVKKIGSNQKKVFIFKYHLQGDVSSSINYGLFYKGKLVSVMTFGKYRKFTNVYSKPNEYELYRYCSMNGVTVVGGANKLFSAFIRDFNPLRIVSYADRRYTTSSRTVYSNLGMKQVSTTKPNYWIVIGNKRYHRFGFRKSELHKKIPVFDKNLTESENLKLNSINIIHDCGNIKFEYILKK